MAIECKKGGRPSKFPKSEQEQYKFIMLYREHTATELADKYGVKPATVRSWASRLRKEGADLNG